ncbi:hypothetical protein CN311_25490 [Mesorhizobium sanjuanii]|uniref:Glycosyltransferase 2-like domain-containing protein n=1 Tax=Mesorhizobium sanjuanii TaxID=2037900 RepID=A0A2A6FA15_9HYPH|nr:glycosyltransferase family 2 protein [Mesorhizobium sanjuanii]PDQ18278.1 hypothetical protein CN311_25490 [Mesorhizobium sanjuanii]
MIVRDEVDIIEKNIRFHAEIGFEHFAIIDNMSVDGTTEVINEISKEIPMTIIYKKETDYRQDIWATEMANNLYKAGMDYGISLDADEIISSSGATIKEGMVDVPMPVLIPRQNMLPRRGSEDAVSANPFVAARYRVSGPISSPLPIMLRKMPGKMFFPLRGLRSIGRGNHEVEHEVSDRGVSDSTLIRHFPVRSYAHFLTKLSHARARFRQERDVPPAVSWHLRRWLRLQDEGGIEEEYNSFYLSGDHVSEGIKSGMIEEEDFPAENLE